MNDTQKMIGKLITSDAGEVHRDAVHVAVMPVIAGDKLQPGDRVRLDRDNEVYEADAVDDIVGIVDPFLAHSVRKGQRLWLFLLPNSVTSLRHVWTHPKIPDEGATTEDEVDFDDHYSDEGRCGC